jgi:hypothetical protein
MRRAKDQSFRSAMRKRASYKSAAVYAPLCTIMARTDKHGALMGGCDIEDACGMVAPAQNRVERNEGLACAAKAPMTSDMG